jgi:uncharacterized protein (TIGR00159 family)
LELFRIGFLTLRLLDVIDILVVAFVIYKLYKLVRHTVVSQILFLILAAFILWKVVELLEMQLLKSILDELIQVGTLSLIIIFAPEIRRFFFVISHNSIIERLRNQLSKNLEQVDAAVFEELISAADELAGSRTGAIMVLVGINDLEHIQQTGDPIDGLVSARLLISIFNKTGPQHDGAVLIKANKILACRCVLPVSDDPDLPPELGLRHRAALGITEVTDAAAIIVSEETGKISWAQKGRIKRNLSAEELLQLLKDYYGSKSVT